MAGEKTIATLVGKLRFEADYRPLVTFEKKLDAINAKMKAVLQLADKKISLKVKLDTKSLADNLKVAQQTKLVLKNVDVSKEALNTTMAKISHKLATARISIGQVRIPMDQLAAQKKLMRNLLESTTIDLPVDVRLKQADKALRAWKQRTEAKFKLYIEADISRQKFYRNVKNSLQYVTGKIGTVSLIDPKVKLTVDRAALRIEIANVLRQIEREAKIKIQLSAQVGGRGEGAGGQRFGGRHAAMTGGVAGAAAHWGRGFIPGLGGAFAVSQLNQINQELRAQELAMVAVTGSEQAGAEQQAWVKNLANTVGLNYRQMTPAYTKMLASGQTSGMSTEAVQGIFQGVSEYGRVMGLDTEAMKGSMRAIEQMMNKGQVMSEELKGQLAERMPGVMSAMAEAAGFGTDKDSVAKLFKAMENGEVRSAEVLEQFADILAKRARNGDALEKAMQSTAAQQERFNNAFSDAVKLFSEGGFDRALGQFFGKTAEEMNRAAPAVRAMGGAFEILLKPVNAVIGIIGRLSAMLPMFADRLGVTDDALLAIGITALANLTPLGRIVTMLSAAALAVEDFMVFLEGGESKFGSWFNNLSPERQQTLKDFGNAVSGLADSLGKIINLVWTGWSHIFGYFEPGGLGDGVLKMVTSLAQAINNLVDALVRMSQGDFSDIMPDSNTLGKAGNSFNNLVDAFLPGTPLKSATQWMQSQTPGAQQASMEKAKQERMANFERNRGSGADVPIIVEKLDMTVNGTADAAQTAQAVQKALQGEMEKTKTNLVQTKK